MGSIPVSIRSDLKQRLIASINRLESIQWAILGAEGSSHHLRQSADSWDPNHELVPGATLLIESLVLLSDSAALNGMSPSDSEY